ncbi:Transcription initiation factor TFIID subunit 12 [Phytophthora cinnamomi]|uniref:Transcription initiation factor TFIID subunit 12 n=1 Tax=Phytophthora cinnamomi TaxID=4785 RepID=UPI0035599F78|nr:Transcription initiation factor TFIID subunit 12 [Phytophthora cinnamomi]
MASDKKKRSPSGLSPSGRGPASPRVASALLSNSLMAVGDSAASHHEPLAPPFNSFASASTTNRALTPNRQLGELLRSIDPKYCFHPAVEELLLDMASDFVQDVVDFSGKLAKHRRSTTLEPRDLQFCLAKNYGISLAGVLPATAGANSGLRPLGQDLLVRARPAKNSLHMHRMALKRKSQLHTKTKLKNAHALKPTEGGKKVVRKASVTK